MALKNWSLPSVVADTETDLLQIGAGKEGCIVSLIISNCETSSVLVAVTLTDGLNAVKGYVLPPATDIKAGTPYYLD